jgi:hypothetical protein
MNTFNTNRTPPFPIPTQVTRWQYGTTLATDGVATSNLLSQKIYPDDTPAAPNRVAYTRKPRLASGGFRKGFEQPHIGISLGVP